MKKINIILGGVARVMGTSRRNPTKRARFLTVKLAAMAAAILAPLFWATTPACAATFTWNGGGPNSNFSTNNWTTTPAPTDATINTADIVFGALVSPFQTTANFDLTGNPNTFTFNASAAAMTITGNALQFAGTSATPIVNNSTNLQTFSAVVRQFWSAAGNKTWQANTGDLSFGNVDLRGDLGANANNTLTITGTSNTTVSGTISLVGWTTGGASLIKDGTGKLTLQNDSSFDTVTVTNGTLRLTGTLSTTKRTSTGTNLGIQLAAGTLEVAGGNINVGTYGLGSYSANSGALNVTAGNVTVGGALIVGWNSSPTFTITGGALTAGSIRHQDAGTGTLTIGGSGVVTATNVSHTAAGGGTDSFTLNLNAGGTLVTSNLSMILTGNALTNGTHSLNVNFDGGTLKAGATGTLITTNPAVVSSTRAINVTVKAGGAIIDTNGKNVDVLQSILHDSGLGATPDGGLTKNGLGTLTLTATNTFSGATTIGAGTLALKNNLALQNSPLNVGASGGYVILSSATTPTFGGLIGSRGLAAVITNGYSSVTALTLQPSAGITNSYSGIIADGATNMNLTKTGAGVQILSGANTYGGATTISNGALVINGSLSAGGGAVIVNSGGTLGGTGTINRLVSVANGGTLSPGNSPGLLTVSDLNLSSNANFAVELGLVYDQVRIIGSSVSVSNANLLLSWSVVPTGGDSFLIVSNDTPNVVFGEFAGWGNLSTHNVSGVDFQINYFAGNGNDVLLTVIPEPSVLALVGLGLGGVLLLRRRRN